MVRDCKVWPKGHRHRATLNQIPPDLKSGGGHKMPQLSQARNTIFDNVRVGPGQRSVSSGFIMEPDQWYWLTPSHNVVCGEIWLQLTGDPNPESDPWWVTSHLSYSLAFDHHNECNVLSKSVYNRQDRDEAGFELKRFQEEGARYRFAIKPSRRCRADLTWTEWAR